MEIKDLFVPYKIALDLKYKGFDELCLATYYPDKQLDTKTYQNCRNSEVEEYKQLSAPLYEDVIKWLEDDKQILIDIVHHYFFQEKSINRWYCRVMTRTGLEKVSLGDYDFGTRQEAINQAIKEAIKLI